MNKSHLILNLKKTLKRNQLLFILAYKGRHFLLRLSNWIHIGFSVSNNGVYSKLKYDIRGKGNSISIGRNVVLINVLVYIRGNGNNVVIQDDVLIMNSILWIEDNSNLILLGKNVTIEGAHMAVTGIEKKIVISDNSMLSNNITIRTGDSHAILNEKGEKINVEKDIFIGKHVWIGSNVTILKGVHIEDNSIVGTGSLVTDNISHSSIAVGIPAKVIKNNVSWIRDRYL